ncbi:MAG: hypothetical protein Q9167_002600 [Letrouitia subvulpina]
MASVAAQTSTSSTSSRPSPNGNANSDYINGQGNLPEAPAATAGTAPSTAKKGKSKKAADPNETSKLLAAKINQLEHDAAGEKDQEAEIEREVKRAVRDLTNLLAGMETLSRIETIQKKYAELLADMKRLDRENVKSKKRADQLQKEKDQGRSELSKTVSMKEKLEKLCRELTRENKKIKEEYRKIEDSEKRSRELQGEKVGGVLWLVDEAMDQKENPENMKLNMETDEVFRHKFKSFIEQYELRELHFQSLMRTKECEVQFSLARYEQQKKETQNEQQRSRTLSGQVATFAQTEAELRSQLSIYVEKFKQVHRHVDERLKLIVHQVEDTLNNSNDLFLTFRREMEEMSKKTKRLEKENMALSKKHDSTNRNILEMAEDRTKVNKEMETLRKKNNTLESVIRRMQDQGRTARAPEDDEEGTESDYEEEGEEYEGDSEEEDYGDETEEEALQAHVGSTLPSFGPALPPQPQVNGKPNGDANGVK